MIDSAIQRLDNPDLLLPVVRSLDSDNGFDPRDWINTQGLKITEEKLLKLMRTQKHTERTEHHRSVTVRPLDLRVLFLSRCFPKNWPGDIPLGDWLKSVQAPGYLICFEATILVTNLETLV